MSRGCLSAALAVVVSIAPLCAGADGAPYELRAAFGNSHYSISSLEIADIDRDGAPELLASAANQSFVAIDRGEGTMSLVPLPGRSDSTQMRAGLLRPGSETMDIVTINAGEMKVWRTSRDPATGEIAFAQVQTLTARGGGVTSTFFVSLALGDVDSDGLTDIVTVGSGDYHSGHNYVWTNRGDGTSLARHRPVRVEGLEEIVALAAGSDHNLALASDGTLWAWGWNAYGQLGDGSWTQRHLPALVDGLEDVVAVGAGFAHSLAVTADGTVWAWGSNSTGQLGDGTYWSSSLVPQPVASLTGVEHVVAGENHSIALDRDGAVWGWGYNDRGQVGDGTMTPRLLPAPSLEGIGGLDSGSNHLVACDRDGAVWTWGENRFGQLGNGTIERRPTPERLGGLADVVAVAAGADHSLAVTGAGEVWSWGYDLDGQLGDGDDGPGIEDVANVGAAIAVAAGESHTLVLDSEGVVWAAGHNRTGSLGNGTFSGWTDRNGNPAPVEGLPEAQAIAAGKYHSLALDLDGQVWAWGSNYHGCLGTGGSDSAVPLPVTSISGVEAIAAGGYVSLARTSDGAVWAWGANELGQLGDGSTADRSTPIRVAASEMGPADLIWTGGNHSMATGAGGRVWAWGLSSGGQLGDGTTVSRARPVRAVGLDDAVEITGGYIHSMARRADGTAWSWGANWFGVLGLSSWSSLRTPARIESLRNVVALSSGAWHVMAVDSDGSLMAWGRNAYGQLGDGSTVDRYEPVRVQSVEDVMALSLGGEHTLALVGSR